MLMEEISCFLFLVYDLQLLSAQLGEVDVVYGVLGARQAQTLRHYPAVSSILNKLQQKLGKTRGVHFLTVELFLCYCVCR